MNRFQPVPTRYPGGASPVLITPHGDRKPLDMANILLRWAWLSLPLMGIGNVAPVVLMRNALGIGSLPLMGIGNKSKGCEKCRYSTCSLPLMGIGNLRKTYLLKK